MADTAHRNAYDAVPYLNRSFQQSTPDRQATLAHLFGLTTPPVDHCRVLELGCGRGGNLIPLADAFSQSEFVGIDLSGRQIAEGQGAVAALGLQNITLKQLNLLDVDAEFGQFDYIIAHGVYSWVPKAVRDHILAICRQNLSPRGVAYISYNANPGWRLFGLLRDAMLYHTRGLAEPGEQIKHAVELLDLFLTAVPEERVMESPIAASAQFFRAKLENLGSDAGAYFFHDLLEEVNEPVYFFQFVEHAGRHGLQYLAEAYLQDMMLTQLPQAVADAVQSMAGSLIDVEQYMDFLRNRTFRHTLLCHQDVPIDRELRNERLLGLHVSARLRPVAEHPDLRSISVERFRGPKKLTFATDHPASKAAIVHLSEIWPQSIAVEDLLAAAYERLETSAESEDVARDGEVLRTNLLRAFSYSDEMIHLHMYAPNLVSRVSPYPVARPVARWQATQSNTVTNVHHEAVELDAIGQAILPLLDGSHDHAALRDSLHVLIEEGHLVRREEGGADKDAAPIELDVDQEMTEVLAFLADAGLLIG